MGNRQDWISIVARRKLGRSAEWRWAKWTALPGGYCVWGGVPRPKTRGKNKGSPTWDAPLDECVVLDAEIMAAELEYEDDTNRCCACSGDGQEWSGWSAADGNRYRPCRRCGATGVAPARVQAVPHV